jgi:hypothetical protein
LLRLLEELWLRVKLLWSIERKSDGPVEQVDGKFVVVDETEEAEVAADEIGVESEKDVALEEKKVEEGTVKADVDCEREHVGLADGA